jgi:hypothetical protein
LAQLLVAALTEAAGDGAALVSVEITRIAPGDATRVEARVERATRTLKFMAAEAADATGARVAQATSVHKLG